MNIDNRLIEVVSQLREMMSDRRTEGYNKGYEDALKQVESKCKEAYEKGYKDGYDIGKIDESATKETDQQKRDRIIQMAKDDIEGLKKDVKVFGEKHYSVDGFLYDVVFIENKQKRTVVALLKRPLGINIEYKGKAKCMPDDCYNSDIGKAIALRRALGKEVPEEYLNVPQPTEIRVGNIIRCRETNEFYGDKLVSYQDSSYFYDENGFGIRKDKAVVLDDTNSEKFYVGQKVKITDDTCFHGYDIGDVVILRKVKKYKDGSYSLRGSDGSVFDEDDCEPLT